jgi:hypothetical protein
VKRLIVSCNTRKEAIEAYHACRAGSFRGYVVLRVLGKPSPAGLRHWEFEIEVAE